MKELKSINKYLLRYKFRLLFGLFFVGLSNWFGVFPAQIVRIGFDLVNENISLFKLTKGFELGNNNLSLFFSILFLFGIAIIVLTIIKGIFMFFMRQTIIVVSRLIEYDLKNDIYEQYQKLSQNFYKKNNTGDLMNRVSEDVSRVRMYIGPAIMYTINLIFLFILVVSTMIQVNPLLTFYSLIPLPFLFLAIYLVQSLINKKGEAIQEQLSTLSTFVQENFSGIRVIKSYGREAKVNRDFVKESNIYRGKALSLAKVEAFFFPSMLFLIGLSLLLTLYVGGLEAIQGNITGGNIAEFIVYVNMLTWPVASVGWVSTLVQRAAASQKRINEFLDLKPEIVGGTYVSKGIIGKIEFKNVSFTYENTGIEALKNISFSIEPGESIGVLGRTGSGKTTIAHLMSRLFDVSKGEILIDGINIKNYALSDLRNALSYVPQEVFLFSDTIENNISFSNNQTDQHLIIQAAKDSSVYRNIMNFPNQFKTQIGERGISLSGGQKQRISIARALIKEAKIYVFDDCLSAVDTGTEQEILESIKSKQSTRSTMMVSHRVSTLKNCKKILVLENGELKELGSQNDLMKKRGLFYEIFEKQLLEEEKKPNSL